MSRADPIVFYFPYRGVGGVSMLFLRLAERLKRERRVFLADYSDGYMAKRLPEGVNLIAIDAAPVFPREAVYVFQSFLPWRFPFVAQVDPAARILFWNLHPKNFNPELFNAAHDRAGIAWMAKLLNRLSGPRERRTRSVVSFLLRHMALVFMDLENVRSTEALTGMPIKDPQLLPLVVPRAEPGARVNHAAPASPLRCAWVGRIADFKWPILEHVIARLRDASGVVGSIRLAVIGEGEFKQRMQQFAAEHATKAFSVDFLGDLPPEELAAYLRDQVDVLFAMGTSALEGARLGLPVFVLDYSYKRVDAKYRFRFLFERAKYDLAEEISAAHCEQTSSLEGSIQALLADYRGHSERCLRFCENYYGLESVAPSFLQHCGGTRATFGDMAKLGFFEPDAIGRVLRSVAWTARGRAGESVVGFRNDC